MHSTPALLRRFAPYFKPYVGIFCLDLFCAGLTSLCEIVLPLLVRYLAQLGMEDISLLSAGLVLRVGAVYLGLRLIDVAAYYFMCNRGHIMGAMIEKIQSAESGLNESCLSLIKGFVVCF